MLEKKIGMHKIHSLWIIGLLKADFNPDLKLFFATELMEILKCSNSLSNEPLGLQYNRTTTDVAIVKLLTFECAHIKKITIERSCKISRPAFIG